ncbi:MAG: flavodoxin family protein [Bacteroidota bacterium]
MKVVAFNGSPRKNGNTSRLIGMVCKELEAEGIGTEVVQVGGLDIHGCRSCYACFKQRNGKCVFDDDIVNECLAKMVDADGIIIGSPTYYANMTSEVKALIDRAGFVAGANGTVLKRKVGAAVVAVRRAGAVSVFDGINHWFHLQQMIVPGAAYWNLGIGREIGEVEGDEEGLRTMQSLGQNMAWLLKKTNA